MVDRETEMRLLAKTADKLTRQLADVARDMVTLADRAPISVGEWREPWRVDYYSSDKKCVMTARGVAVLYPASLYVPFAVRAVACANALAGIKNVEEVPKVLEHVRKLIADARRIGTSAAIILGGTTETILSALDQEPRDSSPEPEGGE